MRRRSWSIENMSRGSRGRSYSLKNRNGGHRGRSRTSDHRSRELGARGRGRRARSRTPDKRREARHSSSTSDHRRRGSGARSRWSRSRSRWSRSRSWSLENRTRGSRDGSRVRSRTSDHRRSRARSRTPGIRSRKRRRSRRDINPEREDKKVTKKKTTRTWNRKKGVNVEDTLEKEAKRIEALKKAQKAMEDENINYRQAAAAYGLPPTTLWDFLKAPPEKPFRPFRGRRSKVFTLTEELKISNFVKLRSRIGYGLTYEQLQQLMQELLLILVREDSTRKTGYEDSGHFPPKCFVYRFAYRRKLVLRTTMETCIKRAAITPRDISTWFREVEEQVLSKPELAGCLRDPRRKLSVVSNRSK